MDDDEKELLKVGAETAMKPFADLINKRWDPNLPEAVKRMRVHTSVYKTILVSDCDAATKRALGYLKGTTTP